METGDVANFSLPGLEKARYACYNLCMQAFRSHMTLNGNCGTLVTSEGRCNDSVSTKSMYGPCCSNSTYIPPANDCYNRLAGPASSEFICHSGGTPACCYGNSIAY